MGAHEVIESLMPFCLQHPIYREQMILERLTEPDRVVSFRVAWEDEKVFATFIQTLGNRRKTLYAEQDEAGAEVAR